jgi:hypothetical protein
MKESERAQMRECFLSPSMAKEQNAAMSVPLANIIYEANVFHSI